MDAITKLFSSILGLMGEWLVVRLHLCTCITELRLRVIIKCYTSNFIACLMLLMLIWPRVWCASVMMSHCVAALAHSGPCLCMVLFSWYRPFIFFTCASSLPSECLMVHWPFLNVVVHPESLRCLMEMRVKANFGE